MQLTQAKRRRGDLLTAAAVAALLAVMSVLLYTGSLTRQVTNMLVPTAVYIVMAVSLNLVVGLLGELSLGHAGFMSVGLFSGCLVSIALANTALPLAVRLPVSMLAGGLVAAVFGLLVGLPALRLRGDYLAIVTLACGEIIKNVITNLNFTGGALGLNTTAIYAGAKELLPYGAVLVLLTVAVMLNLKRSKYGRAIMAIRDNRIAAESVGLNVTWYKLAVFVIAAFFAGCAGVLYGHSLANIKAAAFDYNRMLSDGESVNAALPTSMFAPIYSALNQLGGGAPIVAAQSSNQIAGEDMLARAFAKGVSQLDMRVGVDEITRVSDRVKVVESLGDL